MTERLRWGILATGGIARLFTADLVRHGFDVRAVGSRSAASATAFAAEFGIPVAHASYEALLADPEVDAIYVATPHPMHADNAVADVSDGAARAIECRGGPRFPAFDVKAVCLGNSRKRDKGGDGHSCCKRYAL